MRSPFLGISHGAIPFLINVATAVESYNSMTLPFPEITSPTLADSLNWYDLTLLNLAIAAFNCSEFGDLFS